MGQPIPPLASLQKEVDLKSVGVYEVVSAEERLFSLLARNLSIRVINVLPDLGFLLVQSAENLISRQFNHTSSSPRFNQRVTNHRGHDNRAAQ